MPSDMLAHQTTGLALPNARKGFLGNGTLSKATCIALYSTSRNGRTQAWPACCGQECLEPRWSETIRERIWCILLCSFDLFWSLLISFDLFWSLLALGYDMPWPFTDFTLSSSRGGEMVKFKVFAFASKWLSSDEGTKVHKGTNEKKRVQSDTKMHASTSSDRLGIWIRGERTGNFALRLDLGRLNQIQNLTVFTPNSSLASVITNISQARSR